MWFVHPGIMLAAAGALVLPLLIHLINRRRYRREPWAATMFLLRAHRRSQRRIQLDHWLLLVLRTIAMVALGLVIARPYLSSPDSEWVAAKLSIDRVIVLDDSLSMHARREDDQSSFEAAKSAAERLVASALPGDGIALVTASSPVRALVDRPLHDATAVSSVLDGLHCSHGPTDWVAALRVANEVLLRGKAAPGSRIVILLTDLSAVSLPEGDDALRQPGIDRIVIVNVGPTARGNLSIQDMRFESPIVGPGIPVNIRFRVTHHGDGLSAGGRVQIRVDGRPSGSVAIEALGPGQSAEAKAEVTFEAAGPHVVTASLKASTGDVLDEDNSAHLAAQVASRLPVLMVEPGSASTSSEGSLFYYRVALLSRNARAGDEVIAARTVSPAELDGEIMDDFRVIVLGDVPRLSKRAQSRLARYVRDGGGLIVALGANADLVEYQEFLFGTAEDAATTRSTTASGVGGNSTDSMELAAGRNLVLGEFVRNDEAGPALHFKVSNTRHPMFMDFEGREDGGLVGAIVRSYRPLTIDGANGRRSIDVPLAFSNDLPAILSRKVGRGRLVLLMTGLSMVDTTLPAKPDFVPFALNLTAYASGDASGRLNVETGDALVSPVASLAAGETATVLGPAGSSGSAVVEPIDNALAVVFRGTDQPGPYRIRQGESDQWFAVNVRAGESDLRVADERAVRASFGGSAVIVSNAADATLTGERPSLRELAGFAMYLLVGLVIVETWAASTSGRQV